MATSKLRTTTLAAMAALKITAGRWAPIYVDTRKTCQRIKVSHIILPPRQVTAIRKRVQAAFPDNHVEAYHYTPPYSFMTPGFCVKVYNKPPKEATGK